MSVTREDVQAGLAEYKLTLAHFNIRRSPGLYDDATIMRAMQQFGAEMVLMALKGARREPKRDGFNPASYLSLGRILQHDNIERFANLGAREEPPEDDKPPASTMAKDRALIKAAVEKLKKGEL